MHQCKWYLSCIRCRIAPRVTFLLSSKCPPMQDIKSGLNCSISKPEQLHHSLRFEHISLMRWSLSTVRFDESPFRQSCTFDCFSTSHISGLFAAEPIFMIA
ncbi:hypothetical protein T07_4098 [Trichinella nelsoni]|uniref:Uncharacterized protein n=1 Tax=Trichinella nelsoni TaxID=6336 RepID=A0A0V0S5B8_9BILA|nr:hypothetical protein T07_4098 [Trichinella nelsoni]